MLAVDEEDLRCCELSGACLPLHVSHRQLEIANFPYLLAGRTLVNSISDTWQHGPAGASLPVQLDLQQFLTMGCQVTQPLVT